MTNPEGVFAARRKLIESHRESRMVNFASLVRRYNGAFELNSIGDVSNVWPQATLAKMKAEVDTVPSALLYDCVRRIVWTLSKCLDGRHSAEARSTKWIRAPRGGIFHLQTRLGARVRKGELLGVITEPSGRGGREVRARASGMIMGHAVNPLVHQGDSLVHIAEMG